MSKPHAFSSLSLITLQSIRSVLENHLAEGDFGSCEITIHRWREKLVEGHELSEHIAPLLERAEVALERAKSQAPIAA